MARTKKERICITGAGGRLGTLLSRALAKDYAVTGLGRRRVPRRVTVEADISRAGDLRGAFAGQDAIVHLAAYPFADDDWQRILPANIVGTYNVLEAVRRDGVRRFVMASSLSVLGGHLDSFLAWHRKRRRRSGREKVQFLSSLEFPRPDSVYGASKVFGEALCRTYADRFGVSCVCLRLAEVRPDDRPRAEDPLGHLKMCRHADFVAGVRRALQRTRRRGLFETAILISDDFPASDG